MTTIDYLRVQHFERWSRYGDRFPHLVAEAYAGDLARAMTASDAEVLAMVAAGATAELDHISRGANRGATSEHLRHPRHA